MSNLKLKDGRKNGVLITVTFAFVLALGFMVYSKLIEPEGSLVSPAKASPVSIAVLPFTDLSAAGNQEYFAQGIATEIHKDLIKTPDLFVAGRDSSFRLWKQNVSKDLIGSVLSVAYILEGTFRSEGGQTQITAALINVSSGEPVWLETFDRRLTDIFDIQREITDRIKTELLVQQTGTDPSSQMAVGTENFDAYNLYLQANFIIGNRSKDNIRQAELLLNRALVLDPNFANAWVSLAGLYMYQANIGLLSIDEGFALGRATAEKALAIDPENASAYTILGWIAMTYDRDLLKATQHYQRALQLEPANTRTIARTAVLSAILGRLAEAIKMDEYLVVRDPLIATNFNILGSHYTSQGRLDEALASYRTVLSLSPNYTGAQFYLGRTLLFKGEHEAALEAVQKEGFELWRLIGLAIVHHALGDAAASDAALADLIEKHKQSAAYGIAYVLAYRGEADRAFDWLNQAAADNNPGLTEIAKQTLFANIHDDPRWLPFLESIGMSPDQLAAIEFNVTLPE